MYTDLKPFGNWRFSRRNLKGTGKVGDPQGLRGLLTFLFFRVTGSLIPDPRRRVIVTSRFEGRDSDVGGRRKNLEDSERTCDFGLGLDLYRDVFIHYLS